MKASRPSILPSPWAAPRTQFEHRSAGVAHDRDELLAALDSLAQGRPAPNTVLGDSRTCGKLALLFTGQGAADGPKWEAPSMTPSPVFRDALAADCAHLDRSGNPGRYFTVAVLLTLLILAADLPS